jgi:hypothetical protein
MTPSQLSQQLRESCSTLLFWGECFGIRPFKLPRRYNKPVELVFTPGQAERLRLIQRLVRQERLCNAEVKERLAEMRAEGEVAA